MRTSPVDSEPDALPAVLVINDSEPRLLDSEIDSRVDPGFGKRFGKSGCQFLHVESLSRREVEVFRESVCREVALSYACPTLEDKASGQVLVTGDSTKGPAERIVQLDDSRLDALRPSQSADLGVRDHTVLCRPASGRFTAMRQRVTILCGFLGDEGSSFPMPAVRSSSHRRSVHGSGG